MNIPGRRPPRPGGRSLVVSICVIAPDIASRRYGRSRFGPVELPNDFVIVQIGGIPPYEMLKQMGIAFGGESRPIT